MTGRLTYIWLSIVLAWAAFMAFSAVLSPVAAVLSGALIGGGATHVLRNSRALGGIVAVLEPIGVVLPLLALWHMAGALGADLPRLSTLELLIFIIVWSGFLAASMGVVRAEPYRLGYAPVPVGVMVLMVCLYGALTGNPLLPLIAVAGQTLWMLRLGSSNWFDHVAHAVLVPVAVVALIGRIV